MKKLRWQIVIVVLSLAAIAVLLIGQQPAALLPGVEPAPIQPGTGGVYSEALIGSMGRLNPVLDFYNSADRSIDRLIYSGLIRFDDRGQPYGDLAETWGISQDGNVYNFSIRQEATWHDGEPVTSEDVIFTINLLLDPGIPAPADLKEFWSQVEIIPLDEKTIQFRLPEPFAPFLDYLNFGILPSHIWGDIPPAELIDSPLNLQPVGSGPFSFSRLLTEDGLITGVELKAFTEYYGKSPFFDGVVFKYFPDAPSALAAYQSEEVLGSGLITNEILPDALKDPNLNLYTSRQPRLGLVYFNLGDPSLSFFQDEGIRRALLMGINRQRIIDRVLGGQAVIADGPILPGTWAYYDGTERLEYNPEEALATLKKAGYTIPAQGGNVRVKDGIALAFELLYPDQEPYASIAQSIQQDWAKLGVQANLRAVPFDVLVQDHLEPGAYQAALVELNLGRTPDPDPYPFWHQAQINEGQNFARWDDRQASEYLEQARVQVDQAERLKRYRNFQVRFTNQMPALPLYNLVQSFGLDQKVLGVRIGPLFDPSDRFNTITDWYLLARRGTETPGAESTPGESISP